MRDKKLLFIPGLILVLALAGCNTAVRQEPTNSPQATEMQTDPSTDEPDATGDHQDQQEKTMGSENSYAGTTPAPEFPPGLDWLNTDRPLTLAQLEGKVVVLDFWTYGCINCMHVIPDLKRLEAEYPDELVVVGVHSAKFENEGDTDNIRQIILRYGLEHPVVNDKDFVVWQTWGVRAWPTLVIIDPAGNVVGGHSGEGIYPLFQPIVASLVNEFEANGLLDRTPLNLKLEKAGLPETVLSFPGKVLVDAQGGRLFIADTNHHRIVAADSASGAVLNVIGSGERGFADGDFRSASFNQPQGMALAADGQTLYVADTENHALRQVDLASEEVRTLAGTGLQARDYPPRGGVAPDVALNSPWDLALDGERLYVAMAGTHQLWALDLSGGAIGPFAGNAREGTQDGDRANAQLAQPSGLALDGMGRLYFADSEGSSIRWAETAPEGGLVGTLVGSGASLFDFGDVDGAGQDARLQHPLGVTFYEGGLYVADTYNSKIKRVDPETRELQTLWGGEHGWRDGADPLFYEPGGLDAADGKLYVADTNNHSVRVVNLNTGETRTLALKGIERFLPSADDAAYSGKIVQLAPAEVAAGVGQVRLNVVLPEGYKVNDQAPYSMVWRVEGDVAVLAPDASRSIVAPQFPLALDATFNAGQGKLTGDLTILYCEADRESICLIERVRLEAPLSVKATGEAVLELDYRVELPDLDD